MDATVVGAASYGNKTGLPGAEGDSFDGGTVHPSMFLLAFADVEDSILTRYSAEDEGVAGGSLSEADWRNFGCRAGMAEAGI